MGFWNEDLQAANDRSARPTTAATEALDLRVRLHQRLLDMLNLSVLDQTPREALKLEIRRSVMGLLSEEKRLQTPAQTDQLVEELLDELLGLGPLEPLLKDPSITDILINTHEMVYVERGGRLERSDVRFQDTRHLLRIINKIVAAVGRRVDESQPMVDARLADGSRVNAIIPPLAVDGPLVSIRKFAAIPINMDKLVEFGSVTAEMAKVLRAVVEGRRNVLISGGTIFHMVEMGHNLDMAQQVAYTDAVSNLPNMRAALINLEEVLQNARTKSQPFSVLLIDGDYLRAANLISYAAGDEIIRAMGAVFKQNLRPGDYVARWRTGDEFIVTLPGTSIKGANIVGERFRLAVKTASQSWKMPVTISIGIASYPANGEDINSLVEKAESANKCAKQQGKDQVVPAN